jgi:hypothetical protein
VYSQFSPEASHRLQRGRSPEHFVFWEWHWLHALCALLRRVPASVRLLDGFTLEIFSNVASVGGSSPSWLGPHKQPPNQLTGLTCGRNVTGSHKGTDQLETGTVGARLIVTRITGAFNLGGGKDGANQQAKSLVLSFCETWPANKQMVCVACIPMWVVGFDLLTLRNRHVRQQLESAADAVRRRFAGGVPSDRGLDGGGRCTLSTTVEGGLKGSCW